MPRPPLPAGLALALLLALAACAAPAAPPAVAPEGIAAEPTDAPRTGPGVIVARRPAAATKVRADILGAVGLGSAVAAAPQALTGFALTEFIVRQDSGRTVSVVQDDSAGLRPGRRVTVAGEPSRLSPAD